jgi:hypothetical protein
MAVLRDHRVTSGSRVRRNAASGMFLAQKAADHAYAKTGGPTLKLRSLMATYKARTSTDDR